MKWCCSKESGHQYLVDTNGFLFSWNDILRTHEALSYTVNQFLGFLPLATAGITTFYMFRMWYMTFVGRPRNMERYDHAHESPPVMYLPLVICSVFAVAAVVGFRSNLWIVAAALANGDLGQLPKEKVDLIARAADEVTGEGIDGGLGDSLRSWKGGKAFVVARRYHHTDIVRRRFLDQPGNRVAVRADRGNRAAEHHLVAQLADLSGARLADVDDLFRVAHHVEDRLDGEEVRRVVGHEEVAAGFDVE